MSDLMNASDAKNLSNDAVVVLKKIASSIKWLSENIRAACDNGQFEFVTDADAWHARTVANAHLVKAELAKLGYRFDVYYKTVDNVDKHGKPMNIKMVRISW